MYFWQDYDATELAKKYNGPTLNILIHQGKSDEFYINGQLLPDNLVAACAASKIPVDLRVEEVSTSIFRVYTINTV